jgi:hypothetical protein
MHWVFMQPDAPVQVAALAIDVVKNQGILDTATNRGEYADMFAEACWKFNYA